MDILYINDLQVDTLIGIYDWEAHTPQTVKLSIEIATDIGTAAKSNDINDALDYATICRELTTFISDHRFLLLENMAQGCTDLLMEKFAISWLRLRCCKIGTVKNVGEVGLIIERSRDAN